MKRLPAFRRRLRIGLSIGSHTAHAVLLDHRDRARGEPRSLDAGDLEGLFATLAEAFDGRPGSVAVTLLPPLAESRVVEYPRMRDAELTLVAARHAGRHFLGATDAWVIGARWLAPSHPSPAPVLLAGGDGRLVDRVERAAATAGWRVAGIVPAVSAWAAAAQDSEVDLASGSVEFELGGRITTLVFEEGRLSAIRRRTADASFSETDTPGPATALDRPEELAARYAARAGGPELLTAAVTGMRSARERRRTRRLATVAVVLLSVGVVLGRLSVERELRIVTQHRRQMRPLVQEALATRDGLVRLEMGLQRLASVEGKARRWSPVLAAVADRLPHESHLQTLRGAGDSLALTGSAAQAAPVLDALRAAPAWSGVRADAPIRQVSADDGATREEWSVAGRIEYPVLEPESAGAGTAGGGAP